MAESDTSGVAGLRAKREARVRRQPPPTRHPRPTSHADEATAGEEPTPRLAAASSESLTPDTVGAAETRREATTAERDTPQGTRPAAPKKAAAKPVARDTQQVDIAPNVMVVSPTVLSIEGSLMRRFERARKTAPSHTAIVLDALRACKDDLSTLVREARPAGASGDLFPWRRAPGQSRTTRPEQLRIRPTVGELGVIDGLVHDVNAELNSQQPGVRRASRSEVVAAALNLYLP